MDLRQVLGRRKRVRELYKRTALTLESAGAEAAAVTARGSTTGTHWMRMCGHLMRFCMPIPAASRGAV